MQYNGKEKTEDFSLMYNDHGARNLCLQTGRWTGVDELAHKYWETSPFVSMGNNPIKFVDLDGRDIINLDKAKFNKSRNDLHREAEEFEVALANYAENSQGRTKRKDFGDDKAAWKSFKSAKRELNRANNELGAAIDDYQNNAEAMQQTETAISTLAVVDKNLFEKMNNLEYKGACIDIYVTSSEPLEHNQRDAQNIVGYLSSEDMVITRVWGRHRPNSVLVSLALGTREPDTKLSHEFGHLKTFVANPLRYSKEAKAGIDCQDYNNRNLYQVKDAKDTQEDYKKLRDKFFNSK